MKGNKGTSTSVSTRMHSDAEQESKSGGVKKQTIQTRHSFGGRRKKHSVCYLPPLLPLAHSFMLVVSKIHFKSSPTTVSAWKG